MRIHFLPKSIPLAIMTFVVLIAEVLFLLLLTGLDILPGKYLVLIIAVLFIADLAAFILMSSRKKVTFQRMVGLIMALLILNGIGMGSEYVYSTYDTFQKISEIKAQYEDYHVIVLKNSSYHSVRAIEDKPVSVIKMDSKMYQEAQEKLQTEVSVKFEKKADCLEVGNQLLGEKEGADEPVIFVSNANYKMLCEELDSFQGNTKKLYTLSVKKRTDDDAKRINVTEDPFNLYISGIDIWGDIEQVSRSDVNMIMTVNPQTKKILLTSIPRDSYVELHSYGALDKLTHSGIYGIDETLKTVEDWMDIDLNYYARINFSMLVDVVNAIGGIDVESKFAFKSKISKYTYKVGMNHLDGKAALYFARERKAFKAQDEERIRNQQIVLKAIIDKITTSPALLTGYPKILDAVEGEMQTNLSNKDIAALVKMQIRDLGGWEIESINISGTDAMKPTYSMGSRELFVSIPKEETVEAAKEKIHEVMYPSENLKEEELKEQDLVKK